MIDTRTLYATLYRLTIADKGLENRLNGLYSLLIQILDQYLASSKVPLTFAGPAARIDYVCKQSQYPPAEHHHIHALRDCHQHKDSVPLTRDFLADSTLALARLLAHLSNTPIPQSLQQLLPKTYSLPPTVETEGGSPVYEPDYLVTITTIASMFRPEGTTPLSLLLNRFVSDPPTAAILLGNICSQMLDEEVNGLHRPYHDVVIDFFRRNALNLLAVTDFDHTEARRQQQLIHQAVVNGFSTGQSLFDTASGREQLILEPSFLCPRLGLQGRMDLISLDGRFLLEQKAGKCDEYRRTHKESHYVQMLLYRAILTEGYGVRPTQMECVLFYSKYSDGLLRESGAPQLLKQAMDAREQYVSLEQRLAQGEIRSIIEPLKPDHFRLNTISDNLWLPYIRPRYERLLNRIQKADRLTKHYFYRFATFLSLENYLAKIGTPGRSGSGMAALWTCSLSERLAAGNIIADLRLLSFEAGTTLRFRVCSQTEVLPNFRIGDIILAYPYTQGTEPLATQTIVLRGTISSISAHHVEVSLRYAQRRLPRADNPAWAIEHDQMEAASTSSYRSLGALLDAPDQRRKLLLGVQKPTTDPNITLTGDYGNDNDLVLQAKQARDYFLLLGPPGTGKTSRGLINILLETLASSPTDSVLLLAYTNRAVDEICTNLRLHSLPFIRLGNAISAAPEHRPCMLTEQIADFTSIDQVRQLFESRRIFVSTTASMLSHATLFTVKRFALAIIDEAAQLLEPQLLGILCATCPDGHEAVAKFIMIGDHKQLPAVVRQTPQQARVDEPELHAINLTDCRRSLFERLYTLHGSCCSYALTRQGRMHGEIADFISHEFYSDNLRPVPLPHQLGLLPTAALTTTSAFERALAFERFLFFNVRDAEAGPSAKTNLPEARLIARIVRTVLRLRRRIDKNTKMSENIGIIVPYRHQIAVVHRELDRLGEPDLAATMIDTVERLQGSQRNVIIYGFTVHNASQMAFLTSNTTQENGRLIDRKLNVALTRARDQLILIGNAAVLSTDPLYARVIKKARNHRNF